MGFRFKKRVKLGKGLHLNFSKSGVSPSVKVGNVTYNPKRGTTVNFGHGLTYHTGTGKKDRQPKKGFIDRLQDSIDNKDEIFNRANAERDSKSDNQLKWRTIGVKILWGIITIMLLMLSLALPFMLIFAIGTAWFTWKYDARERAN